MGKSEKEIRNRAIDEFAKQLKSLYPMAGNEFGGTVNYRLNKTIDEVAEKMKGGAE